MKMKDSKIIKFKIRLVARKFSQVLRKDYIEIFASTVYLDTLYIFLASIAKKDLECSHFNINNTFTESYLMEEIYLVLLQGIHV
jgi:hypothetical protein